MFSAEGSERTVQATPQRRAEARRQGHVPYSSDFDKALAWGGIAALLAWQGPLLVRTCGDWLRQSFSNQPVLSAHELTTAQFTDGSLLMSVLGLLASLWIMTVALHFLQVGFVWVPENARPRTDRVSPLQGLNRLFSGDGCVQGGIWLLRSTVICGLVVTMLYSEAAALASLSAQSPGRIAVLVGQLLISFLLKLCGVVLLVAAIDLGWQWWKHERSLRMTNEEWRQEQQEADTPRRSSSPSRRRDAHEQSTPAADSPRRLQRL